MAGEPQPRRAGLRASTIARVPAALLAVLATALVWRFPSLFDPPWVNDEGTYFAVAQSMAHGARLYVDVWENKPPGIYLLYFAVYHLFGASLLAVRLVAAAAVSAIVAVIFALTRHVGRSGHEANAALFAAVILGVPVLEGTTGNAEVFLAVFTSLGVWFAIGRRQPSLAGVAMAVAILFKAVAAFDTIALGLWLAVHHRHAMSSYGLSCGAVLGSVCAAAAVSGVLPAMLQDAVFYDLGYVGHANGGSVPWLLLVKAFILIGGTAVLVRRPFPALWLLWSAAGALVSGRLFGHYLLQPVPALSVCLGIGFQHVSQRHLLTGLLAAAVSGVVGAGVVGATMVAAHDDSILAERLLYYPNIVRKAAGLESNTSHTQQIDDHAVRNMRVAEVVRALPPGKLLVWGNTPWIYVLSRRLPATPYTSARRHPEVPGETQTLARAVRRRLAREVVVIRPADPALGATAAILNTDYRLVRVINNAAVYVLRR